MNNPIVTLGYVVMASVEGKKTCQPISRRYSSFPAALAYCDLAKKSGFKDAYVESVDGFEPDLEAPKKRKKEIKPKSEREKLKV